MMIIPTDNYDYLLYLAEELQNGDNFEKDARHFKQLAEILKKRVYHYCQDRDILAMADQLPTIELTSYRRSFLEQLLPRSGREMVGNYKTKEKIRKQVQETITRFAEIRRWLGED